MGINGEGIAYDTNNKPIFIPRALIDEVVDIKIIKEFDTYKTAELVKVIKQSDYRIKAKCKLTHLCGGCPLMILQVKKQLEYKKALIEQSLIKYTNRKYRVLPVIASEDYFSYRNQFKFPVKLINGQLYSGLYQENTDRLVTIERCIIHNTKLEVIRNNIMKILNLHNIKDYYERIQSGLRCIVLRGFNDTYQLTLITGKNNISDKCINDLFEIDGISSIYQNINISKNPTAFSDEFRLLCGSKTIELKLNNLVFRLSPNSFFQLNTKQAIKIYDYVNELVKPCNLIVEAYSGIGAMGLITSSKANKVKGIEYVNNAVKNANLNAKFNHLNDKVNFVCGDAAKYLELINEPIDYLIVDPPRSGLDDNMLSAILKKLPSTIIYVSCNHSTLAKNIASLSDRYNVEIIQPFDMFTNTAHVECITLMTIAKNES